MPALLPPTGLTDDAKPSTTATLQWKNVEYGVTDAKGQKRTILRKVSGHLRRGRLTAIIGPSGAGKTSLLNLLSGRSGAGRGKTVGGEVRLRGDVVNPAKERDQFSYVMQEDHLWPTSTPKEAIRFAAKLRSVGGKTVEDREERIAQVIEELGLEKCQDSIIGGVNVKGISGGERKRVAIGIEIVSQPAVLFLDEPTSGLDSYSAKMCVEIMREIAHSGKNVLTTIHQPSSEIFHLFDDVIFMCQGRVVYQGPLKRIKGHFAALKQPCPDGYNIADHVMETMQTLPPDQVRFHFSYSKFSKSN
jgi:ABC-type multidrug transport system ATPase subunit